MEPVVLKASIGTEALDAAVSFGSCGVVDLLFTHITAPVLLILSPVSDHVALRLSGLPTTRHEGEQVMQASSSSPCTNNARFLTFSSVCRRHRTPVPKVRRGVSQRFRG